MCVRPYVSQLARLSLAWTHANKPTVAFPQSSSFANILSKRERERERPCRPSCTIPTHFCCTRFFPNKCQNHLFGHSYYRTFWQLLVSFSPLRNPLIFFFLSDPASMWSDFCEIKPVDDSYFPSFLFFSCRAFLSVWHMKIKLFAWVKIKLNKKSSLLTAILKLSSSFWNLTVLWQSLDPLPACQWNSDAFANMRIYRE